MFLSGAYGLQDCVMTAAYHLVPSRGCQGLFSSDLQHPKWSSVEWSSWKLPVLVLFCIRFTKHQCGQLMALRKDWHDQAHCRLLHSDVEFLESQDSKKMQMEGVRGTQSRAGEGAGESLRGSGKGKPAGAGGILLTGPEICPLTNFILYLGNINKWLGTTFHYFYLC